MAFCIILVRLYSRHTFLYIHTYVYGVYITSSLAYNLVYIVNNEQNIEAYGIKQPNRKKSGKKEKMFAGYIGNVFT